MIGSNRDFYQFKLSFVLASSRFIMFVTLTIVVTRKSIDAKNIVFSRKKRRVLFISDEIQEKNNVARPYT